MVLRHAILNGGRGGILSEKRRRRAAQAPGGTGGRVPHFPRLEPKWLHSLSLSLHRYMCRHVHICNQHEKQSTLQQASCVCRLCRFTCVCARESAGYVCMYVCVYIYVCVCLCFCLCVCVFACLFFWSSATDTKSEATSSESIPCQGAE